MPEPRWFSDSVTFSINGNTFEVFATQLHGGMSRSLNAGNLDVEIEVKIDGVLVKNVGSNDFVWSVTPDDDSFYNIFHPKAVTSGAILAGEPDVLIKFRRLVSKIDGPHGDNEYAITFEEVNKVVFDGDTLIDLTEDTATESDVAEGKTFHLANGKKVIGKATGGGAYPVPIASPLPSDVSTNEYDYTDVTLTAPDGYEGYIYYTNDGSDPSKHSETARKFDPHIPPYFESSVLIRACLEDEEGNRFPSASFYYNISRGRVLTVTENGTYYPRDVDNATYFSKVNVNVPTGGSGGQKAYHFSKQSAKFNPATVDEDTYKSVKTWGHIISGTASNTYQSNSYKFDNDDGTYGYILLRVTFDSDYPEYIHACIYDAVNNTSSETLDKTNLPYSYIEECVILNKDEADWLSKVFDITYDEITIGG